jgi:protein-tyrosine phosphatase
MNDSKKIHLLFVCMGNICRSPSAEGVMRKLVQEAQLASQIVIDSAGTHAFHAGDGPDLRSQAAALMRGIDLSAQRARTVTMADYADFDLLLAMDWDNLHLLQASCPTEHERKCKRLMEFSTRHANPVVPDPYYGGPKGFDEVLDLCEDACEGLLKWCVSRLAEPV